MSGEKDDQDREPNSEGEEPIYIRPNNHAVGGDHPVPDDTEATGINSAVGLASGGLGVQRLYEGRPLNIDKSNTLGVKNVKELIIWLSRLEEGAAAGDPGGKLERPRPIVVNGALFLCGLLTAGWWKRVPLDDIATFGWNPPEEEGSQFDWKSQVQKWQFHGFGEWAPSWDFSWFLDKWDDNKGRKHYFAQIGHGEGDEADSIPVYMGERHAQLLRNLVEPRRKEGKSCIINVKVSAVIAHRSHFPGFNDPGVNKSPGGWLNYCVWIDPEGSADAIQLRPGAPELYSGYLWKCFTLRSYIEDGRTLAVDDVFFIWVHTDFSKPAIVAFGTDLLNQQQASMERHVRSEPRWNMREDDEFVLLAKSSWLLEGDPIWTEDEIYAVLRREYVVKRRP